MFQRRYVHYPRVPPVPLMVLYFSGKNQRESNSKPRSPSTGISCGMDTDHLEPYTNRFKAPWYLET